jgi:hypothetical protein
MLFKILQPAGHCSTNCHPPPRLAVQWLTQTVSHHTRCDIGTPSCTHDLLQMLNRPKPMQIPAKIRMLMKLTSRCVPVPYPHCGSPFGGSHCVDLQSAAEQASSAWALQEKLHQDALPITVSCSLKLARNHSLFTSPFYRLSPTCLQANMPAFSPVPAATTVLYRTRMRTNNQSAISRGSSGMRCLLSAAVLLMTASATLVSVHGTWSTAQLSVARAAVVATSVGNIAMFAGGFVEGALFDSYEGETRRTGPSLVACV